MKDQILILLLMVIVVAIGATAVYFDEDNTVVYPVNIQVEDESLPHYFKYVVYDGMPCIRNTQTNHTLTCDWSRWRGTIDGNTVIIP